MSDLLPLARELDEYTVTPGVLGFIVFALLGVGVWILLKSMSRHLGKIAIPEEAAKAGAGREGEGGADRTSSPSSSPSSSSP